MLQYMVKPWLQYEAYGIRVTNNLVYNTWGAGLGVAGGYNVLMAYNTVYRCHPAAERLNTYLLLLKCSVPHCTVCSLHCNTTAP
jgi:hypothetical protein